MKKTVFIKNAAILTISSLILRLLGVVFRVWLANFIGAEGIGLYQLIFSVYVLVATFATSGISTAVTRLVSDELIAESQSGAVNILKKAIYITVLIAVISLVLLIAFSSPISIYIISDIRAVPALRILGFSLPFMGVSSCLRGYFIARRKASPNASTQIFEQAVRIGVVFFAVSKFSSKGLAFCCGAVLFGDTIAEAASCTLLYYLYKKDLKNIASFCKKPGNIKVFKGITHIALPITAGRYLNTLLRTAENILVPKNLAKCVFSGENALSQFGMIKGMALPILFFPSTLLNSLSTLLIPEMSDAKLQNRNFVVRSATEKILRLTFFMGVIFGAIFFTCGIKVGEVVYKSDVVGLLIKYLSPIVPLMYLDSVSDGILKGLDQQLFTFKTAVFDSGFRIVLILIFLPVYGLKGFIAIMYFSNALTCGFNVTRLIKITGAKFNFLREIMLPLTSALAITFTANNILNITNVSNNIVYIITIALISIFFFLLFLFGFNALNTEEIKYMIK